MLRATRVLDHLFGNKLEEATSSFCSQLSYNLPGACDGLDAATTPLTGLAATRLSLVGAFLVRPL